MRIGILTYHRSHNYGALLQAIALLYTLRNMGHDVFFIDYVPEYVRYWYSRINLYIALKESIRKRKISILYKALKNRKSNNRRYDNFEHFIETYIDPYCRSCDEEYDLVVYGSDQIWRKQPDTNEYDPWYFGKNNIKARIHLSYAASMGELPVGKEDINKLKMLLSSLDAISVREGYLQQFILNMGCQNVITSLDPTMLLDKREWLSIFSLKSKWTQRYALFYNLLPDSFDRNEINKYAEMNHLDVITLNGIVTGKEKRKDFCSSSPIEFLSLIEGAEFVFTSSYHGMLFSIIFEKNFFVSFSRNYGRAEYILKELGLSDRLLVPKSKIPDKAESINYPQISNKIDSLKRRSLQYITNSFSIKKA